MKEKSVLIDDARGVINGALLGCAIWLVIGSVVLAIVSIIHIF